MPDNVDKLFEIMQAKGAASDRDKFRKVFLTPGNKGYKIRKDIYDGLRADGIIDSPTYEDFRRKLRLGGTPTVNKYRQQMFSSVDPNKSRASELTHRAVGQAVRATNNVRKPVVAKVVNQKGKPTGKEFAITPAKTVEDLDREYAQEATKNWENELHDQMSDADKDAAKISDMFKSFIGSTDEVGSVWGNMTRGGGIAGTPHSVTTNNGILENTEARQILAAGDYNRKRRELLQLEQDSRNGAIFDNHSFFRGMYDAAKDTGFLTGGASDLINAGSLLATKQDLDNGVHTEAGDMLMQQAVKNSDAQSQYGDNQGWMYTGGVITTNMAPFMMQVASAGFSKGMSNAIGKVVQGAASKVALGTMEKATGMVGAHIANYIGKVTGLTTKAFGKAIQYGIVGAAQANTVGLGNVANDVINRYTGQVYQDEQGNYKFGTFDSDGNLVHEGGEDFLTALAKGDAAQTIEFATELAGGGIDAVGTILKNFVTKGGKKIINKYNMENVSKVIDFLLNNKVSKNARYLKAGADRTLGKVEVNSIVGESLEEELGIIANTVFTGDNKISDLWDEKQQSQIWGGMLLSIGLMKGAVAPFHAYNAKQYYSYKHKLDKADVNLSQLLGKEKWEELRNQIDATTNDDMPEMVNKINRDVALGKSRQPVREYIQNLLIMRGYDIGNMLAAKKAVEDKGEGVSVKNMEKNQAYQQGRDAYGYDTHEIQLDQEDKQKSLAQLLGISEQQLASMSDEELEALSGRDDNIDRAIYDYQLSTARYEGVIDNARDQIDLEVQRAAQAVDMYTDKSRNTIRNATIKATGGLEDYGVYIINGNIATHEDGSIDISNSDDMILYYDPTTNTVEHADAMMFAELGSEENADEVRSQAMADAKEKAIKETTGIIDGVVDVGTQFKTVDADGTEHTYEVLADNGDGTAMITIDGNIPTELVKGENVNVPVSFEELQKMKDESDQQRLQAAKAEREQMEKERTERQNQQTEQTEETQPSFDFNQILNDDGNVVLVDVLDKDSNTKYPNSQLFLIRDSGAKAKVMELTSDGSFIPHAVNKKDVRTATTMTLDEYKQAMPETSMIEDNSGTIEANRGGIDVEDNTQPLSEADADNLIAQMESSAEAAPDLELTPDNWTAEFGEDGILSTPIGDVKMGENQVAKLFEKGRSNEFGMIKPTLKNPDVIIEVPSHSADGNEERSSSYLFIKTFFGKNGKKVYYFKSVTIKKDGLEISISSHYDRAKRVKEALMKGKLLYRKNDGAQTEQNQPSASVTTSQEDAAGSSESKDTNISSNGNENNESLTFEDGTPIPVDMNGEVDLSQTDASHAAEWYDNNLGEDADDWLDGEIKKAKKVLEQAKNKKLAGTKPSELVASKKEKEAAIADAQAHYDSAISIRDSLKERRIAKEENTSEGRTELIEKARRKFARLKSAVKDDAEAVSQLYRETIGSLLHRLYDGTGIDVTDTIPLTAEEYVASNLGAHSLNYEGTETSKGVKQETGLSREDFAKTQLLAADVKGTTIDALVHSLWENRPSNLESLDTQDIRNALIGVLNSGFKASEARNFVENIRIAQAENILEEQKRAQENAAYAEQHKAEPEAELKAKSDEKAELKAKSEAKLDNESDNESNDLSNETDNEKINDNINDNINVPEVPEDATDEKPLGEQISKDKVPFEIKGEKSGETYDINDKEDRKRLVAENSVDDKDILDIDMPKHVHKAIKELCKKMGLKVQFLYMGARLNGWVENGTMYLALDANKAIQCVFGHEMTHAIKQKNPEAYKELVKVAMAVTTKKKFEEDLAKIYRIYHNASGYNNIDDFVEEVIADNLGKFINDFDLAQKFSLRLNHPVLATILHAIQKIKGLLYGDFYKSVDALERIVEKAYVDTAKGEVTNSETGEDVSFSLRQKPEPKKKGIGYKVFVLKDGKLYPPMVANPDGAATPVGVWLDADAAPIAGESKTGRPQVKQGGKGTQGGSGKLAYRPGWHLGIVPYAIQFNRKDADGNKTLFPKNFVFAEVEYAADVDYQEEARQEGINPSGKYQHSLAGLKHLPTDGYYMYRTNPNPETDPWVITGAMKVNRILTRAEQAELVKNAGREPQQIQEGDIVTDDVVNSINQEIADAPKFSIKTYHGSQASFDKFDHSFMGSGEGAQAYGWGTYVSEVEGIAKAYAKQNTAKRNTEYTVAKRAYEDAETEYKNLTNYIADSELNINMYNIPSLENNKKKLEMYKEKGIQHWVEVYEQRVERGEKTIKEERERIEEYKLKQKEAYKLMDEAKKKLDSIEKPKRNLYSVDIPDDTGRNYIGWDEPLGAAKIMRLPKVFKADGWEYKKVGMYDTYKIDGNEHEVWLEPSLTTGKELYRDLTNALGSDKAASEFLSKAGFVGVKVIAQRNAGGNKEGKMNYVIFDENNAQITSHTKFSLKKVNDAFNQRLDELVKNPNQKDKILRLGRSSSFLKAGGIADAEIELDFDKLMRKSKQGYVHEHPFDATDVKDLPMAIANPISVFDNTNGRNDGQVILTELKKEDRNFIVAIQTENQNRKGGVVLKVNKIVTLFPKDARGVINWFNQGKATNIDKEKALHFIEALQNHSGTTITDEELKSAANIINSFETTKENGEKVDVDGTKFSLKDEEYLKAVEDGNMEKAQKMVNEAADAAGYSTDSSYQGTSAFNGAAPWGNGYFLTKDERKEAWDNGEFEGESTLGDYINDDIDGGNLEELTNAASYRAADPMRKEAIDNVRNAIQKKAKTITMYRSVPSDVKEGSFRNGDWVTPSRAYAVDNAKLHGWGDDYNIIEQKVPVDDVWFDGNDIAEWGYGREEDYINDTDFAYKNSKNNKKLLDAVTYDDNGNVIPLSQRFNEKNKDVRFSLKDEKTLAGVHNITEEKLRKALKLGGFANPSLAVIDTNKTGHDNFGEISFIAPSALLDKRTGNTGGTWITDAYTQRYPSVEREMSEKGYRKFEDWVDSLDYPSGAKAEIERQAKDALSDNNAPAWELMYLKEKGIDIKEYDSRIDYRWKEIISDHPTAEDILNSMKTDPELNEKVTSLAKHAIIHPTWEKVSLEVRRKMYKETGVKASPINPQVRKQTKEIFERDYAPTLLNKDGSPRKKDVKKVVEDIVKEHNDTKKYDFYLSKVKASNYVNKNGLYDDYIRWQENKLDEFGTKNRIFRGYTRDGSRKYVPETLENVSKAMREEADGQTNGSEYTSFGSFIAKLASRVDSTDEMRANKDKLSSNKDKEEFYEKWSDVYYDLAKFLYNDVFYGEQRLHDIVLQSDPKKYAKKEYGITLTPTFMKKLDALKNAVQTELKSAYFETKYNRPLRLNEFAAAVVPDNLGKDVRKGIENAGLPMYDYDPNKEGDRSRAFNEAINSSDNIRFSLAGERGAAAADKAEERTFRMDNLSVAKDMEKNKKKAKAIKAATGWERGADGKWRYEMPDVVLRDPKEWVNNKTLTLSDIVEKPNDLFKEYPELFDAYPKLKDVKIQKGRAKMGGSYYDNTITLNLGGIREAIKYDLDIHYKIATRLLKRTLVHEVQHYIQHEEGFAKGGSEQFVRDAIKDEFEKVIKQIRGLRAEGKEDEAKALAERNKALYNAYANEKDSYKNYKSLSGEVEARNVSARLNMTPEERRKTLAESTEDVARKDQIFLGVGDVSFSLRDMADGKESGAADMAEDLKSLNTPDEVDDAIKTAIEDMPSGWKMANRKMIHIAQALGENRKAEIAGEEPKFSLKDGTLIKAGTYFSGGGLVEEGLKGIIDPVVAVEYDEKISGVYRNNFGQHIVTSDVRDVDPKELVKQIDGEVEYFHASPVCKNYSQAKSNHAEVELDKETAASTAEFINAVKPKVVTIENVKGYKDSDAMKIITDALDANGYTWDADVYNAADYGGYTNRERLIVRAVRDGKLPAKPEKMARKSGWYEAVADIIPTLTEKKNGVAPWMDIRLKADGIDWRNIDKPLYVMGSAYADGKVPHAFADELLPTLRTKSGDVIVMPDGKVYRAMGRVLARVSGVSDDYKMPFSENLSHIIIGNGIPTQLTEHVIAPLLQNTLRPTTPDDGNTKFSLRYDQFEHDLNQWKKDNNLPKDAQRPTIPQRNAGESAVDFLKRVDEYRKQMALWKTAPTYEQHLLSDDTALGEFNRELQRGSVLKRIAFQDSMLAIRKAQEAIMKEVGVDRLNMAEDAYTAENRSHGKGKNEFEEYNNEFLQPLRKAYHQMKKILGDSYDNVRIYMMAKHGLERDAQMAFKKSLEADYEDVAQRSAAYNAYKGDMNRIINDSDLEFGRVDFTTWRQRDNALRVKYSPSYMDYRYDKNGIAYDYSGLSALFDGSDFEEDAYKLVKDIEDKYVAETHNLWDATNAATKKILRDGYKAGMMSKDTYQYVRDMYSHYIPLRGWDGTTADQVWDYIGGGKGAFNQTLKKAHGRTSIADDPIAYIENMAESGILLNNKNWVKQHLMLLAQNHPTSLLTLSKAWYVKSTDANGNEEWIPATPQITSQMNSNQVKAAIDAFEQKMEQMAQAGDATQKRDGLNIAYPQTHSEEREHEVRVMKDGEEYVIYVNGDPQLAQAMNNTRAHRVREIQSGKLDRAAAWLGRKMAAAYTSLSPLFIPSNYFRDLTMTLSSTAIREDAKYNYLLRKNLATSWNLGFMLRDFQNGKLRDKVNNGNATPKEQMFYDFMMNGGETGFVSSLDVEDLKKKFKNDLKDLDRWKTNLVKVGHTIMDSIEFLNRAIEDSNRFAVYMTSIQCGRSVDEAVNDAKDVTLNFNRKGTGEYGWQMIRNLYLFINPAVQSLQTLGALAKHHPFKFTAVTASWLASGVLVPIVNVALMQLGAAFLGGDGDDDKDWYKDISKKYWQFSKWDRRNNFIMWVPTTHEFVKIPLAQEFRAFYGLGDMIASKMMGGELAEESWEDYGWDLVGQVVDMLPLDPTGYDGNIAVSLMPNAIRPVFELAFNVDFTGKPLFKETEYNKYDPNFTKAYVGTPDWLVRASRMMNSIGNDYPNVQQNKWDALGNPRYNLNNPAVVDHVLSSYLGGAYTMGSQVLGLLTKSLNDRKEIKVADIPLVSKFVSNPDDRPVSKKQGDEFWDKKEYYDRASNTISKLKKQAKIDGDYSLLERFYGSEEYKTYKLYEKDVKDYKEARKKERAEESGDEYRPHQLNAEDIYNNHATPMDEFEDMKLKQLFEKLNSFKTRYDSIVDNAPNESDAYYNTNKAAIDAIDEISLDKQEISELKKGFLDDGKDAYNAEDMKQIRDLRKKILSVLEKANKVVVANQKAKAKK